eukprot:SAG31_NODE_1252_length_9108_cov_24.066711_1_plen_508_part_00
MDVILQKSISRGTNHLLMLTTICNQNGWMVSQLTICKMIMYCGLEMQALLTDWVAYYRTFVLDIRYLWTQVNVFMPGGSTVDTAMYFGDKGAPCISNHAMNWLLYMWQQILRRLLQHRTSWDAASGATRQVVDAWDADPRTLAWRQMRFHEARRQGMTVDQAEWQSMPIAFQGYFDDAQVAAPKTLMPLIFEALFSLVNIVGVAVEYDKLTLATADGQLGTVVRRSQHTPRKYEDVVFEFEPGHPVILGKQVQMPGTTQPGVGETLLRRQQLVQSLEDLARKTTVWQSDLRSLLGRLIYVVMTVPTLRGAINEIMHCLKAKYRFPTRPHTAGVYDWHKHSEEDALIPLSEAVSRACTIAARMVVNAEPLPLAHCLSHRDKQLFIMNDAAGFAGDADTKYRGGGAWIWRPGAQETQWCTQEWPEQVLRHKHSTELEIINANASLEAVLAAAPAGTTPGQPALAGRPGAPVTDKGGESQLGLEPDHHKPAADERFAFLPPTLQITGLPP